MKLNRMLVSAQARSSTPWFISGVVRRPETRGGGYGEEEDGPKLPYDPIITKYEFLTLLKAAKTNT